MFSLNSGKLERGHDIVRTETDEEKKHASQAFNHRQMKELFEAQIVCFKEFITETQITLTTADDIISSLNY